MTERRAFQQGRGRPIAIRDAKLAAERLRLPAVNTRTQPDAALASGLGSSPTYR